MEPQRVKQKVCLEENWPGARKSIPRVTFALEPVVTTTEGSFEKKQKNELFKALSDKGRERRGEGQRKEGCW